jgi:kumamolisin
MPVRFPHRWPVMAVALVAGALALSATGTATASSPMVRVAQGIDAAALPGAQAFGTTPPNTPETVAFVLQEQDIAQLESSVEQGVTSFLSVSQFANTYGQSPGNIARLRQYLAGFGIATQVYADDVDVVANGTAGEFNAALDVTQHQYDVPALRGTSTTGGIPAQTVHGSAQEPALPASIASYVLAILGLTNYAPYTTQLAHISSAYLHPLSGSSNSCVALTGEAYDCNTAATFASDYGLDALYNKGALGQGETVATVTLAALDPGAPEYYWKHILGLVPSGRTLTVDNVDGGPGAPSDASGSGETDIDVEQNGGVAPDANVIVYQAPNSDYGFADGFFAAASQDIAGSVATSWGESETAINGDIAAGTESPAYEAAFDEALLELAAQGQSAFASSGDAAAYDASDDIGTTNLAVDTPGSSPYVTASGGTTLPWSGKVTGSTGIVSNEVTVPAQRIWGWDYLWPAFAKTTPSSLTAAAEANVVGGGGGFSSIYPEPSYQDGVSGTTSFDAVPYLTPIDPETVSDIVEPTEWSFNPFPTTITGSGSGRAVPDLSANADPFSGYLLYEPSATAVGDPALQGGWGGTSFVSQQFAGSAAVIESSLGHRVGFWNPLIYSAAKGTSSPLTPLDASGPSNDNVYYSGTPGTLYNEGAGLGYPNLAKLAASFG